MMTVLFALTRMLRSRSQVMAERLRQNANAASICWLAWFAQLGRLAHSAHPPGGHAVT